MMILTPLQGGALVVAGGRDGDLRLWDLRSAAAVVRQSSQTHGWTRAPSNRPIPSLRRIYASSMSRLPVTGHPSCTDGGAPMLDTYMATRTRAPLPSLSEHLPHQVHGGRGAARGQVLLAAAGDTAPPSYGRRRSAFSYDRLQPS